MVLFWPLLIAILGKVGAAAKVAGAAAMTGAKGLLGGAGKAAATAGKAAVEGAGKAAGGIVEQGVTPALSTPAAPSSGSLMSQGVVAKSAGGQTFMGKKLLGGPPSPQMGPGPGTDLSGGGGGILNQAAKADAGGIVLPNTGGPGQGPGPGEAGAGGIQLPEGGGPKPGIGQPGSTVEFGPRRPNAPPQGPQGPPQPPQGDSNWLLGASKDLWGQTPPGQFFNAIGEGRAAWNNPAYSGGRRVFETAKPMLKFGLEQSMSGGGGGGPAGPPPGQDEMDDFARQQMMERAGSFGSQSPSPDWRRRLQEMQRQRLGQAGY